MILGHLLEILAGDALVGASGVAEAPSLGTSTAGDLGGGSLIYNGIDGLEIAAMNLYLVLGITVAVIGAIIRRDAVLRLSEVRLAPKAQGADIMGAAHLHRHRNRLAPIRRCPDQRHRWLNIAVVVIMIGGVAFDWIGSRRPRTS